MAISDGGSKDTNRVYKGHRSRFTCSVQLDKPLPEQQTVGSITLVMLTSGKRMLEDGCYRTPEKRAMLFYKPQRDCRINSTNRMYFSADVTFNVTSQFLGDKEYRCDFKTIQHDNKTSPWHEELVGSSEPYKLRGEAEPLLKLEPDFIEGFEGDEVEVRCAAYGGYPARTATIKMEEPLEQRVRQVSTFASESMTTLTLSDRLDKKAITCSTIEETGQRVTANIRVHFLRRSGESRALVLEVTDDTEIDCARVIESNVPLDFVWSGAVVRDEERNHSKIKVAYNRHANYSSERVVCNVSITGDMRHGSIITEYQLHYRHTQPNPRSTYRSTYGAVFTLLVIAAVLAVILIFVRELDVDNRVRVYPLPYHEERHEQPPKYTEN